MASPSIRAGLDRLRANPMRTLLSTLGVIMGSASLIAALSLGGGAEAFARKRIQQEGYNHIIVEPITSDSVDGERIARAAVATIEPADVAALSQVIGRRATGTLMAQSAMCGRPPAADRRAGCTSSASRRWTRFSANDATPGVAVLSF